MRSLLCIEGSASHALEYYYLFFEVNFHVLYVYIITKLINKPFILLVAPPPHSSPHYHYVVPGSTVI